MDEKTAAEIKELHDVIAFRREQLEVERKVIDAKMLQLWEFSNMVDNMEKRLADPLQGAL